MNINQIKMNEDKIKFQKTIIEKGCWQCCHNCVNWSSGCKLFNAMPPVEVVPVGCNQWIYEIPFQVKHG